MKKQKVKTIKKFTQLAKQQPMNSAQLSKVKGGSSNIIITDIYVG